VSIFIPNIPQAGDDPKQSQLQLLGNFQKLNSDWQVNHVALTAGNKSGYHTLINFAGVQDSAPSISGENSALYPKLLDSVAQLFFKNSDEEIQLTGLEVVNPGDGTSADFGITTPWGLIINFGTALFIQSPGVSVTWAIPFSSSSTVYGIYATTTAERDGLYVEPVDRHGFKGFLDSGGGQTTYYLAIGE